MNTRGSYPNPFPPRGDSTMCPYTSPRATATSRPSHHGAAHTKRAPHAACRRCARQAPTGRPARLEAECAALQRVELDEALRGELEEDFELRPIERAVLARALHLHEPSLAAHDDVHVDVGRDVLHVLEIEQRLAADDAHTHTGHAPLHRRAAELALTDHPGKGIADSDGRPGDRGSPRSAIGLEDVAVHLEGVLAPGEIVEHGANAAADEPLNLLRAPPDLRPLAWSSRLRRARQHCVFRGDPPFAASAPPGGDAFLDGRRAEHSRCTKGLETAALAIRRHAALEGNSAQRVGWAAGADGFRIGSSCHEECG